MLSVLSRHAPAPAVVAAGPRVLAMEFVANAGGSSTAGEGRLAEIVAGLHTVTGEAFGFGSDTRIGPIRLRQGWHGDWARFYVEQRLRPVCAMADERGTLPRGFMGRLDDFAAPAGTLLGDPTTPGLIHGDLWAGNVLWRDGLPAALIDHSTRWADPEFELAFIDLMGGVSGVFWERHGSLRPIRPGFRERRVFAYQVFPLAALEQSMS